MKNNRRIKLIAASAALITSFSAMAGLGGLTVQSNLGEPFSGTVTVTGEEARILLSGGQVTLSDNNLRSSVRKSGDNAVVTIRSGRAVQDPVLIFQLGVGAQARQYTAIIDPPGYAANTGSRAATPSAQTTERQAARERVAAAVARNSSSAQPARQAAQTPERRATPAARTASRPAAAGSGRHTVRQGETLTAIAARVRPSGLSTYQTVQALVAANPELFREHDADKIWPGNVLHIPSAAELRRLAQAGSAVETVETPAAPPSDGITSAPASTPAAPVETPVAEPASAIMAPASAPITTEAPETASEPAILPSPQATEAETTESSTTTEPSSGLWRWLLLGGLGLIALWILSKLLGKKQKTIVLNDDEDQAEQADAAFDDIYKNNTAIRTEQPVARPNTTPLTRAETTAAATAAKTAPSEDELEIEDDFDDDIFFTEVSEAPVKSDENFSLDLNEIERQQSGILTGAVTRDAQTEQRKDADWDKIESTDSVYEPEPQNPYRHAAAEIEADTDTAVPTAAPAITETLEENLAAEQDFVPAEFAPLDFEAPAAGEHIDAKPVTVATEPAPDEPKPEPQWLDTVAREGGIEFQDHEDLSADQAPANSTEIIEWAELDVPDSTTRDSSGFISESVGMTAPLEAKYELAKMYVEIGDPEAAKETLLELLEESDGAILAKAEAMLRELEN
ncbi:LysM peptidoglycan-binding domain-containing protein [Uruburuella testudinis]|uniref:LysM peptidoglycan-binding domain-containing protein n=1 Tax=Uruburuella testudinis TaxID=1282863 RepID=A0ABY4DSY1_9NEIS|nr:FimV/HubP family polar landmark protein [Uruburuella testudinis]UOO81523.1 LysM peptidoglycan-binding domain-containing protein [Uruburuella testudinis]